MTEACPVTAGVANFVQRIGGEVKKYNNSTSEHLSNLAWRMANPSYVLSEDDRNALNHGVELMNGNGGFPGTAAQQLQQLQFYMNNHRGIQ